MLEIKFITYLLFLENLLEEFNISLKENVFVYKLLVFI